MSKLGFKCGIVGLPNVGKSTLFNALMQTIQAQAENYPFCTIEPNSGIVTVPDERLYKIASITKSQKILPTTLEIVDIAGLVKGASKGEGLGNQFLGNIRNTDAIIHVLRCFENPDVIHVEGGVNPLRDLEIIETELMLADIDSLTNRKKSLEKKIKSQDKETQEIWNALNIALEALNDGNLLKLNTIEPDYLKQLQLLSAKKTLYVCNVSESDLMKGTNQHVDAIKAYAKAKNQPVIVVCAEVEAQLAALSEDEQKEYLTSLSLKEKGLNLLIREGYELLDLITFFTSGPKETRAWTVRKHSSAPKAAAVIHTDFERGFICAATISYEDFINFGGEQGAKDAGKLRVEGKEYIVQDGDIIHFRFNV